MTLPHRPLVWLLIVSIVVLVGFLATIERTLSRRARQEHRGASSPARALLALVVLTGAALSGSFTLVITDALLLASISTLLWLGPMPDDMPSALDPAVTTHPLYPAYRRRGQFAGAAMIVLIITACTLVTIFVHEP